MLSVDSFISDCSNEWFYLCSYLMATCGSVSCVYPVRLGNFLVFEYFDTKPATFMKAVCQIVSAELLFEVVQAECSSQGGIPSPPNWQLVVVHSDSEK